MKKLIEVLNPDDYNKIKKLIDRFAELHPNAIIIYRRANDGTGIFVTTNIETFNLWREWRKKEKIKKREHAKRFK